MAKLRLEITKGEDIRYISHLDYASAIERSIIRANLPAAYSEGFNPHMKLSFASALAVGVTSQAEYMDIDLSQDMDITETVKKLVAALPPGIMVQSAKYMPARTPALMAIVNLATYDVVVPFKAGEFAAVEDSITRFNEAVQVLHTRETPKGRKEIEVKQYMKEDIRATSEGGLVTLAIDIKITPTGSIKPGEILAALVVLFDLDVDKDSALINRTGLYIAEGKTRVKPTEL